MVDDEVCGSVDGIYLLFQAENLKENVFYEFQVRAMNMAGLSKASVPSAVLECKEWTITLPGTQAQEKEAMTQKPLNVSHALLQQRTALFKQGSKHC